MRLRRRKSRRSTKKMSSVRRRRTSRRRMGAITQSGLLEAFTLIGGAVASRYIVNQVAKSQTSMTWLQKGGNKALVQVGLGLVTPMISKNPIVNNLSKGMIVSGGFEFFKTLAPGVLGQSDEVIVVSGMDEIGAMDMLGANEISEINGVDEISEINGISDYDYNY